MFHVILIFLPPFAQFYLPFMWHVSHIVIQFCSFFILFVYSVVRRLKIKCFRDKNEDQVQKVEVRYRGHI